MQQVGHLVLGFGGFRVQGCGGLEEKNLITLSWRVGVENVEALFKQPSDPRILEVLGIWRWVLGGSWDLVSGGINKVTILITTCNPN